MSLCHLNSFMLLVCHWKRYIPNVHFLLQVAERQRILGHSQVWKAPRNQRILGNLGSFKVLKEKSWNAGVSEDF